MHSLAAIFRRRVADETLGIVTESDVTRRIAFQLPAEAPVRQAMSAPVETLKADDYVFPRSPKCGGGCATCRSCAATAPSRACSDLRRAYGATIAPMVGLIDALTHEESLAGLREVKKAALKHRVAATGTAARIDGLRDGGVLSRDERDQLSGAFRHATAILLRQQLADFRAGRPVGNVVPLRALSRPECRMLVGSFRGVERLRTRVAVELGGRTI